MKFPTSIPTKGQLKLVVQNLGVKAGLCKPAGAGTEKILESIRDLPDVLFRQALAQDAPKFANFLHSINADDQLALNLHKYFDGASEAMQRVASHDGLFNTVKNLEYERRLAKHGEFPSQKTIDDFDNANWNVVATNKLKAMGYKFPEA